MKKCVFLIVFIRPNDKTRYIGEVCDTYETAEYAATMYCEGGKVTIYGNDKPRHYIELAAEGIKSEVLCKTESADGTKFLVVKKSVMTMRDYS